ncbi:MmgE/PrpD family protein [Streptomyces hygroscopicus subsp. hygroscopicus]|uniref:2-methylcitrate dehydratase n=1 Tax=Streptomyces hygroscopicus TaxID=1912 RepID=A0ABQ3TUF8_STRHY|nr:MULTISPECIES: MmgE/PrpD family protein [Streptomyces]MBW8090814.1 MmgE/PrpD family protein [Streptomyces hygroscopicus subsp. hygroscopicus]MCO8307167.1 MmgE/PrpD family protein [Streptomyces sp. RKCA744]MDN3060357.1 MmgE/PrpD family protein [Streptomyces sp. SRF1]GHJ26908.1 2-methylcitrate dehydratase [Streptomyces hygroscopicus]
MTTATDSLAALAHLTATTRIGDLPEAVTGKARHHLLDTLGAALAGADSTETTAVLRMLTTTEPTAGPGTPVWGTGLALSPRGAALANGVSAHALELDDTGGCDHSGAVVVPAALAAVSAAPAPVSGADLLTAVVVGYDIARRVLEACGGYWPHNEAGWHSTGTCGPFGAAAAAAAILRLDADRTMHALALAGSLSAGIWAFVHDGAMSKRLHAGRAAEAGVTAALLAAHGVTGPAQIFDDVWGGFLRTFAPAGAEPAALTAGLGREWRISRCSLKPYASCRSTHSSVDAVGAVLDRHGLGADDVAGIHVRLNRAVHDMCGGTDVTTLAAAQLSLAYAVAARIAFGGAGLDAYDEEKRHSPRVRSVLERIVLEVDPAMDSDTEPVVTVVTRTGARHEQHVADPLGSPTNPLDGPAVRAKFDGLAARVLPPNRVRAVADTVQRIESLADATTLMSLLGRQNRR